MAEGGLSHKVQISAYPEVAPDDPVPTDTFTNKQGNPVVVADEYRSLENPESKKRKRFVDECELHADKRLRNGERDLCKNGLTLLNQFDRVSCPQRRGGKYYSLMKKATDNHWKLVEMDTVDGYKNAKDFFNPNKRSKDGLISLEMFKFSPNGQLCAIGYSKRDCDWITVEILQEGEDWVPNESLKNLTRFSSFEWKDNETIVYDAYDTKDPVGTNVDKPTKRALFLHKIGRDQLLDERLSELPENEDYIESIVARDSDVILVTARSIREDDEASQRTEDTFNREDDDVHESNRDVLPEKVPASGETSLFVYDYSDRIAGKPLKRIRVAAGAMYKVIDFDGRTATLLTNHGAPLNKLVRVTIGDPVGEAADEGEQDTEDLLNEATDKLEWSLSFSFGKQTFYICCYLRHVSSVLQIYLNKDNVLELLKELFVPPYSTVSNFRLDKYSSTHLVLYYMVENTIIPGDIYEVTIREKESAATSSVTAASATDSSSSVKSHDVESMDITTASGVVLEDVQTKPPSSVTTTTAKSHEVEDVKSQKVVVEPVSVKPKEEPFVAVEEVPTESLFEISEKPIYRTEIPGLNRNEYTIEQVFYPTNDCERLVPMFLVYRTALKKENKPLPCLMRVYGGFGLAQKLTFNLMALFYCHHFDGIYAVACVRGGSEYGKDWHDAGRLENKPRVIDDLINGAKYLVQQKLADKDKLTAWGASNGGMIVAATMIKDPTLFKAIVSQVGVHDLLRYHLFTHGIAWRHDYGLATLKDHFDTLLRLSPLHTVFMPEYGLPWLFFITGDNDDRVATHHTIKLIAKLYRLANQVSNRQKNEILMKIYKDAGHGQSKRTAVLLDEAADIASFIGQACSLKFRVA